MQANDIVIMLRTALSTDTAVKRYLSVCKRPLLFRVQVPHGDGWVTLLIANIWPKVDHNYDSPNKAVAH